MELTTVWFILIAVLWIGYFILEGFDFGVGMLLPVIAGDRDRAPRHAQHDRPGLGRQRGLGARGRRRHIRRLPRVVRHPVQRVLPAAAADPRRPDRARPCLRVPRASATTRPGGARWDLAIVIGSAVPALLWGVAFANIVRGSPDRREQGVHRFAVDVAQPLRPARWDGHIHPVHHPRSDVPRPEDRRRHPAPGPRAVGEAGAG